MKKNSIFEIREAIKNDNLKDALFQLEKLSNGNKILNETILNTARYNGIKKLIREGSINYESANIEKNKIISSILELLDEIESEETDSLKNQSENENSLSIIQKGLFLLIPLLFLIFGYYFYQESKSKVFNYTVITETDDKKNSDTNDKVLLKLIGDKDSTNWILLHNQELKPFELETKSIFNFQSKIDIGQLKSIKLTLEKVNTGSHLNDLTLGKIQIKESINNNQTHNKEIDLLIGDGYGERNDIIVREILISWIN